jgi:prolycopene isomerase
MADVIVIGAGFGGLICAAKLARAGRRVLLLEKCPHIGGTSYVFRRGGYAFPMGPLAFSFPRRVMELLGEAGVRDEIGFVRNSFGLKTPEIDITYSSPLAEFEMSLGGIFPRERPGIKTVLGEIRKIIDLAADLYLWHPDFRHGRKAVPPEPFPGEAGRVELVESLSRTPSSILLKKNLSDPGLIRLLGSMGTSEPAMSLLNLAFMWNMMSEVGIWSPSCGIHGLADLLHKAILDHGGEVRLGTPVSEIILEGGRAAGVRTETETLDGNWVVSNADYKTTFLRLMPASSLSPAHLSLVRSVPYTSSELCVYLGIDPSRVDLEAAGRDHLFYQKTVDGNEAPGFADFSRREIEICRWSKVSPWAVPEGKEALILRTGYSFDAFSAWRTGEKQRKAGYREMKRSLALNLVRALEDILPGLEASVEVMEIATPLTYQDWGNRHRGSVAGWTWTADGAANFRDKLLVRTPVPGLLAAGIYAATQLFLGGVPTALQTGSWAADIILED